MGSDTLVWTRLGKQNFTIRVASERAPGVGDTRQRSASIR